MELTIAHRTTYTYSKPVTESHTVVHLQPRTSARQFFTDYELDVDPVTRVFSYTDRFGNAVQHFSVVPEHDQLCITARSRVVTIARALPPLTGVTRAALDADGSLIEYDEFLAPSPFVASDDEAVEATAAALDADRDDLGAYVLAACKHLASGYEYRKGMTTIRTPVSEVIAKRAGVCQDFAHVLIALIRARGIPARYASGYIHSGSDPMLGADASHAWAEAYLPPYGWVGFDPTNDRLVDDGFVLVALGRDYGDVSPTRGLYRGQTEGDLTVSVAIDANEQEQQQQQ